MKFQSKIYQSNNKSAPWIMEQKYYWISIGLCLLLAILLSYNKNHWQNNLLENITGPILFILVLLFGFFKIKGMLKKEPLNGTFQGEIIITSDYVIADEIKYEYSEIADLNLSIQNYSGKLQGKPNYVGPWRSKGTDNQIYFRKNNQIIKFNFLIDNENDFNLLKKIKSKIKDY